MLLSARALINVADVNTYDYSTQVTFIQGDQLTVYFQIIDLLKDRTSQGFPFAGRRRIPASGATLTVTIPNIVTAPTSLVITKVAVQPFPGDLSIWSFNVLPTDNLLGPSSIQFVLSESGVNTNGYVTNFLSVVPKTPSFS